MTRQEINAVFQKVWEHGDAQEIEQGKVLDYVEALQDENAELKYLLEDHDALIGENEHRLREEIARLREALSNHWVTDVDCDHEHLTDTVRCACSVWTGTPQSSVGNAIKQWVDHVFQAALAPKEQP